ncbi:MAG: GIY-YIG nuclease family protein [Candidatus Pacebacteria bacterium]|nr:GIY-YIG nuclease family protein [Candidatus Paceibacterota bacterium]
MKKTDVKKLKLPDSPGVYIFRNSRRKILYIGKATSLRSRVRSYFNADIGKSRGALIVKMLEESTSIDWELTDSVLEALILEANLIKKHQPLYNSREKDNKSFNYLVITKEKFPRILVVRGRELFGSWKESDIAQVFGPFPYGGALKEGLTVVRKIFPFRDRCEPEVGKPCFNKQIGLCPGVCSGEMSKAEYSKNITHIRLLFEGKKKVLIQKLEREMKTLAKKQSFERAGEVKRKIFALMHIRETSLLGSEYKVSAGGGSGRLEAYDVAHISETSRVGVMTVVEDGEAKKTDYRKFNIRTEKMGDIAALEEILRRRFEHNEWAPPSLLVIDGGVAQKNAATRILSEFGYQIPIVNVVKNAKHKAGKIVGNSALVERWEKQILLANSEAHRYAINFHRQKRRKALI